MPAMNRSRKLVFADRHLEAVLIEDVRDFPVTGIVVNLDPVPLVVEGAPPSVIRPWRSLMLREAVVRSAGRVAVLRVADLENLGAVSLRG